MFIQQHPASQAQSPRRRKLRLHKSGVGVLPVSLGRMGRTVKGGCQCFWKGDLATDGHLVPLSLPGVSDCLHRNHLRAYNTCKESLRGRWSLGICIFTSFLDDYNVNKS